MLSSLHFLLTYSCTHECDHCFLYCSPRAQGTFTVERLEAALDQGIEAGITSVYFEGGEPFLFYPLLLEAVRLARSRGLQVGLVTNGYWASSAKDAELWLRPLAELGIEDLSISSDAFHSANPETSSAEAALEAGRRLGLPASKIRIEAPVARPAPKTDATHAVVGGDVLFKGRAADRLTQGLPTRPPFELAECPHEELRNPDRVHIDPRGDIFVCQGIAIGNVFETPLRRILADYRPTEHPIVGPLLAGGPAALAERHGVPVAEGYVDHCHMCFRVRQALRERFGAHLRPAQVYGDVPAG